MSAVAFVLVETKSPGNLGAVCRVAKAFGFPDVRLVQPRMDPNDAEASRLAHGAEDVLETVRRFPSLAEAVQDCHRAIATTARPRNWGRPVLSTRELSSALADSAGESAPWALVFGREDRGLTNKDLVACDAILTLETPAGAGATLSLPQAATIVSWELRHGLDERSAPTTREIQDRAPRAGNLLDAGRIDELASELMTTLDEIGFRPRPTAIRFRGHVRDFIARARPTEGDHAVLRGIFAQVGKWRRRREGERAREEG